MKKDLTFNVDDFLKRLETIHEISCGRYNKYWILNDFNVFLNPNFFDLKKLDFYQLNENFLIRVYAQYGYARDTNVDYFESFFHLITGKFLIQIITEGANKIFLNFQGHINIVTDVEIENIKKILFEFIENADISNKITSFDKKPISHELFFSDIKNSEIFYLHVCQNTERLWYRQQINF